jgi:hypothetical protein
LKKRKPVLTQEYFDKAVAYEQKRIPEMEQRLAISSSPARNRAEYSYSIFHSVYEFPILLYSAGESISQVKAAFLSVLPAWERYQQLAEEAYAADDKPQRPTFVASFEDYVTTLWLISLAIIFAIDDSSFTRLVGVADEKGKANNEGQDLLYESLVATRLKDRKKADKLLYPKPYRSLYAAINAPKEEQPKLFKEFLQRWYPSMKSTYWHDCHNGPEGGGFFGYWAIEARGVVKAFNIDDSSFRDSDYYPRDLS